MPPVIQETIPTGSTYVLGSASTVTQPSGTTTTTLYYDASIASWTSTEPAIATDVSAVQWWLDADIPATGTFATRFQVTAAPIGGQVVVENTGGGSFGGGAAFLTDTTNTFINGANSLGDTVFADDGGTTGIPGDGIQNGDEGGVDNIGISLYVDVNGDGALDPGDLLWSTTSTSGGGSYGFPNLPDADFLVVMDDDDPDISTGWGPSSSTTVASTLTGADDLSVGLRARAGARHRQNLVGASPVARRRPHHLHDRRHQPTEGDRRADDAGSVADGPRRRGFHIRQSEPCAERPRRERCRRHHAVERHTAGDSAGRSPTRRRSSLVSRW